MIEDFKMMREEWQDVKEFYPEIYDEVLRDVALDYEIAMDLAAKEHGFKRLRRKIQAKFVITTYKFVIFPFLDMVTHRKQKMKDLNSGKDKEIK